MSVLVLGAGNRGSDLAAQLIRAGHSVLIASRSVQKAFSAAVATGAERVSVEQAPAPYDVVLLATEQADLITELRRLGSLDGKVIIDIAHPPGDGSTADNRKSGADEIAKAFPKAKVVKAFNTFSAMRMISQRRVA